MAIASKKWMPEKHSLYMLERHSMNTNKVVLHTFTIGDVEEPYLYAAGPIYEWKNTEKGQWCMSNCEGEVVMHTQMDHFTFGYKVLLQGELNDKNLTYFRLKWGQ